MLHAPSIESRSRDAAIRCEVLARVCANNKAGYARLCEAEGDCDFGGDATGGERFLDEDADACVVCFLNDALMRVFKGVELDHECIDESASKCLAIAIDRFSAEAEMSNRALGLQFGERFKCAIVLEDVRVVAVGVDEDEIELRASESRETCVDACANGFGREDHRVGVA